VANHYSDTAYQPLADPGNDQALASLCEPRRRLRIQFTNIHKG
jgi:hypothetical protein